jgi:hypothetical protein
MTVMIALPPEIESRLRGAALRCGLDVGAYATQLIAEHVPPVQEEDPGAPKENDDARQLRGFIPIQTEREPLFTQGVAVNVRDLPKWKPGIDVSRRVLSEVDDV